MLDGEGARIIEGAGAGLVSPAENSETLAKNVLRLASIARDALARPTEE